MPLGIAALAAHLRNALPEINLELNDLSVGMRRACFDDTEAANLTVPFFTGHFGNFFDEALYRAYQIELLAYFEQWRALENALNEALAHDFTAPEVGVYDARLQSLLPLDGDEVVGLSAAFPEQVLHAVFTAKLIKRRCPDIDVLLGGAALSVVDVDELLIAVPELDYVFRGEGEAGLTAFLEQRDPATIRGLSYRVNGSVYHNAQPHAVPVSTLPPADLGALPLQAYLNPVTVAPVSFSRGCRWRRCRFCSHNFSFSGYRTRPYEAFVRSLWDYKCVNDISRFYFSDQYIGADDLRGISEEILRQDLDIRFHVMGRPSSDYSREILETAFEAGCRWISWGVESFSARLLKTCNKGTLPADVARVLADSKKAKISNLAMMIFGLPGSDDASFQETLDTAAEVSDLVDAFTSSSFQLFEGTAFFRRAETFGLIPEARETLFAVLGNAVHSYRRGYSLRDGQGKRCLPRAANEVAKWKQWQLFVRGGETFFETLPAEHYLLYAVHRRDGEFTLLNPTSPVSPRPFRRTG